MILLYRSDIVSFDAVSSGMTANCSATGRPLFSCARQLSNGVRVATEAGAGPVASLTVSVDVGSRYESAENNGVCSVIGASAFYVSSPNWSFLLAGGR